MTCITYKARNRHTTRRHQRETPALGSGRQNRYTDPLHTASARRRHTFATAVLDATGGNLLVARQAGGWASARTVEDVYGHPDLHDPVFTAALARVWAGGQQ